MPPRALTLAALACACLVASGCLGRADHPVVAGPSAPWPAPGVAAERAPEPAPPDGRLARWMLFLGWEDAEAPLRHLAAHATPADVEPRVLPLPLVERGVLARYRAGGPVGGAVREVLAVGFSAVLPLPPRRAADLLTDPAFEKDALDADRFETVAVELDAAGVRRERAAVELLGRGEGPIRVDLRFTSLTERWDLPDGSVIMRHDPYPFPPPEHVTLYRGAAWIVPEGTGCRVTEFLVLGTDIRVPFFLRGLLRARSYDVFRIRATRIWRRAQALSR